MGRAFAAESPMSNRLHTFTHHVSQSVRTALFGPQIFAFLPAAMLFVYWFGGEAALISSAIAIPIVVGLVALFFVPFRSRASAMVALDSTTSLPRRNEVERRMDVAFAAEPETGKRCVAMVIEIDALEKIERDHGHLAEGQILQHVAERLQGSLRSDDFLGRLEGPRLAIVLTPSRGASLEASVEVAARLQEAISEPISIDGLRLFLSITVGFCVPRRASEMTGATCLDAAESALEDAKQVGQGSIRAYAMQHKRKRIAQDGLVSEVEAALEAGDIRAWFQPQLSTDTGEVSGVEALARWHHREHGVISPGAFLPAVSAAGLTGRLGEVILFQSLTALRNWQEMGIFVPSIGVNFAAEDLSDPKLCEKIEWELDRFGLQPERLTVEILETVIAQSATDVITMNIRRLADLGCRIDLDDFGTGHSSIANIRRFFVNRIKIDRSFVTQIDKDRQQQQMLTAILEMAGLLNIETIAEGVESLGEHTLLAQLGCSHVQGYHIGKPMPFDEASDWLNGHSVPASDLPKIARKSS